MNAGSHAAGTIGLMQAWKRTGIWNWHQRAERGVSCLVTRPGPWSVVSCLPQLGHSHTHGVTAWQAISHSLPTSQTQNCCHHLSHSFTTTRHYGCELLSPHSSCSPWIPVFSWGTRKLSPLPSHTLCGHDQATRRRHHVIRLYFTYIGLLAWLVSGENIESIYWVLCAAIYQRQL